MIIKFANIFCCNLLLTTHKNVLVGVATKRKKKEEEETKATDTLLDSHGNRRYLPRIPLCIYMCVCLSLYVCLSVCPETRKEI